LTCIAKILTFGITANQVIAPDPTLIGAGEESPDSIEQHTG